MGLLKIGLKIIGSAALVTTGVASTVLRTCSVAAGKDELADNLGGIQDMSFDTIRDMWTPDEKKDDKYYEAQAERSADRADNAMRAGNKLRQEYDKTHPDK